MRSQVINASHISAQYCHDCVVPHSLLHPKLYILQIYALRTPNSGNLLLIIKLRLHYCYGVYLRSSYAPQHYLSSSMGPTNRLPCLHTSFSLPSLHQLHSSDLPIRGHLIPPPLRIRTSSTLLCPLLEELAPQPTLKPRKSISNSLRGLSHTSKNITNPRHGKSKHICSLCLDTIPDHVEPCAFPQSAPAALAALSQYTPFAKIKAPKTFCHTCWVWIHNLSICWTCGDTVTRKEERVSYGWCWWHWGCVSCLLCRVCPCGSLPFAVQAPFCRCHERGCYMDKINPTS